MPATLFPLPRSWRDGPIEIPGPNGATGYLHKCRRGSGYLLAATGTNRMRFGNAREIREDVEHFQTFGTLPTSKVTGWA